MAQLFYRQANYAEAERIVEQAISNFDKTTFFPETKIHAYGLRARLRKQRADLNGALTDLAEELRSVENLRPQIGGSEETRAGFFKRRAYDFDLMVSWQLEIGRIEKALEYAERGRARVLLDQLAVGKIDLRSGIPARGRSASRKTRVETHSDLHR